MLAALAVAQGRSEQQAESVSRHETILSGNGNRGLVRIVERHDAFWAERAQRLTLGTSMWVGAMVALATLLSAAFAWLFRGG